MSASGSAARRTSCCARAAWPARARPRWPSGPAPARCRSTGTSAGSTSWSPWRWPSTTPSTGRRLLGAPVGTPRERVERMLDAAADRADRPGYRGCAYVDTRVEVADPDHPVAPVAQAHKRAMNAALGEMLAEAGDPEPESTALLIQMLFDGAIVHAVVMGNGGPIRAARAALPAVAPALYAAELMETVERADYRVTFAVLAVGVSAFALLQSLVTPVLPTIEHALHTIADQRHLGADGVPAVGVDLHADHGPDRRHDRQEAGLRRRAGRAGRSAACWPPLATNLAVMIVGPGDPGRRRRRLPAGLRHHPRRVPRGQGAGRGRHYRRPDGRRRRARHRRRRPGRRRCWTTTGCSGSR